MSNAENRIEKTRKGSQPKLPWSIQKDGDLRETFHNMAKQKVIQLRKSEDMQRKIRSKVEESLSRMRKEMPWSTHKSEQKDVSTTMSMKVSRQIGKLKTSTIHCSAQKHEWTLPWSLSTKRNSLKVCQWKALRMRIKINRCSKKNVNIRAVVEKPYRRRTHTHWKTFRYGSKVPIILHSFINSLKLASWSQVEKTKKGRRGFNSTSPTE